jgi:hypothetical protein
LARAVGGIPGDKSNQRHVLTSQWLAVTARRNLHVSFHQSYQACRARSIGAAHSSSAKFFFSVMREIKSDTRLSLGGGSWWLAV